MCWAIPIMASSWRAISAASSWPGGYLAIGAALSALTKNQVIAFVITAAACFLVTVTVNRGAGFLKGWAPAGVLDTIATFSFYSHFNAILRGVIDLRDVTFFGAR